MVELKLIVEVELFGDSSHFTKEKYLEIRSRLSEDLSVLAEKSEGYLTSQFGEVGLRDTKFFPDVLAYHKYYGLTVNKENK